MTPALGSGSGQARKPADLVATCNDGGGGLCPVTSRPDFVTASVPSTETTSRAN